ncbi:MAG: hypothetical protein FWH37_04215 [Candidatus Bathyarchaeota archaeon]|nr:hypothetical protein [Candidatus Termiticorpusculum sp.]
MKKIAENTRSPKNSAVQRKTTRTQSRIVICIGIEETAYSRESDAICGKIVGEE